MQMNKPAQIKLSPGKHMAADWLRDMPQQFQGKMNIEILIRAFSRQMEEVCLLYTSDAADD